MTTATHQASNVSASTVSGRQARHHGRRPVTVMFSVGMRSKADAIRAFENLLGRAPGESAEDRERTYVEAEAKARLWLAQMREFNRAELREGIVDSGVSVFADSFIDGVRDASMEDFVLALSGRGFNLTNVYVFTNAKGKVFLRILFAPAPSVYLPSQRDKVVDALANAVPGFVHIWDNRDADGTITVNFPEPFGSNKAKRKIAFRDGSFWGLEVRPVSAE